MFEDFPFHREDCLDPFIECLCLGAWDIQNAVLSGDLGDDTHLNEGDGVAGQLDEVLRPDALARLEVDQLQDAIDVADEVRRPTVAPRLRYQSDL